MKPYAVTRINLRDFAENKVLAQYTANPPPRNMHSVTDGSVDLCITGQSSI